MNTSPFRALIRKDIVEALRIGGLHIAMSILGALGFALIPVMTSLRPSHMRGVEASAYRTALRAATSMQMPLLVLCIMMLAGNSIVSTIMTREKTRKTMIPILCSGVTPKTVWAAKVAAVFVVTYIVACLALALYVGGLSIIGRGPILPAAKWAVVSLVCAPLVSLASFGVTGIVIMLYTRAWYVSLLLSVSPILLASGWYIILGTQHHMRLFAVSSAVCLAIIALCWAFAAIAPRERVSGVLEWD